MDDVLTAKRQAFIMHYLADPNGTKAALAAGYSKKTAKTIANQLLSNKQIKKEIAKRQQKTSEKLTISREMIAKGLIDIFHNALPKDQINAAAQLNKMFGFYEAEKHKHEHEGQLSCVVYLPDNKRLRSSNL